MFILKPIATPIIWVILFLVCGLVLTRKEKHSSLQSLLGWYSCLLSLLIVLLLSIQPVEYLLVSSLESKFKPVSKSDLARVDTIVVLSGGVIPKGSFQRTPEAGWTTYARLFNGVEAFKESKAKKLVLSGGGRYQGLVTEAGVMRDLAVKLGIPQAKIITEERSYTTEEQAQELHRMGVINKNTVIGLVTSAMHMMRSVYAFKKEFPQVKIIPIPAGFIAPFYVTSFYDFIPNAESFEYSTLAIHEWIGLVYYKLHLSVIKQ